MVIMLPDFTSDRVFKYVFKAKETEDYIVKILENILKQKIDPTKIEYLDTEIITSEFTSERGKITDCYILYNKQYRLIFECNKKYYNNLFELKLRYINALYNNSFKNGKEAKENNEEFILININDFKASKRVEEYYYKDGKKILTKKIKIINISLESIKEAWYNKTTLSELEILFLFLKIGHLENEEVNELIKGDEVLMNIKEQLRKLSNNEILEALFDKDEEDALELDGIRNYERECGREEGRVQGEAKGEAKGRLEEKSDIIKTMYAKKVPLNTIAEIVKLDLNKVKEILML